MTPLLQGLSLGKPVFSIDVFGPQGKECEEKKKAEMNRKMGNATDELELFYWWLFIRESDI